MDNNKAIIDFLLKCEPIYGTPLYFNFATIKNGINQLISESNQKIIDTPYIDGSVKKKYSVTFTVYLSISSNPLVKVEGIKNENIEDLQSVQNLMDWVNQQDRLKNYPDFGKDCIVEKIGTTTDNPRLDQIDATLSTPLAKYVFTIEVEYVDNSEVLWK